MVQGDSSLFLEPKSESVVDAEKSTNVRGQEQLGKEDSRWSVFEHARDAMVICSPEGQILKLNERAARMFGYERRELVGEKLARVVPQHQQDSQKSAQQEALSQKLGYDNVGRGLVGTRKDGSELPIELRLAELNAAEGALVIGIIRDRSDVLSREALKREARFEKTIAQLSARFVNLPMDRVDEEVVAGLEVVGRAVDADRATVALIDEDSGDVLVTHAWADQGVTAMPKQFVAGVFPWLVKIVLSGEAIPMQTRESLPEEAQLEKQYMESTGLTSFLALPFQIGDRVIGGLACDSFRQHEPWDDIAMSLLQRAADLFGNVLARKNADEKLSAAYKEIQTLKEQLEQENIYLREEIKLDHSHIAVVGSSAAIRSVLKKAEQVAPTDTTVLVLGETGTGKELVARTIHELSKRNKRPMVKTNCAALPATLIESELFGREKGAYTGALAREIGRFELANESTIFLDEIGELPPDVQSKLLRVLQEGEFERLGSSKTIKVNVRVIAATSRNLDAMVKEGKFREDLYYRLNVFPVVIPPLRERTEDIPALVWHILHEFGKRMGRKIEGIQSSTMRAFQNYSWPGNVRELRNVIERNLILNTGPIFKAEVPETEQADARPKARRLDEVEADYLRGILQSTKWRVRGKGGAAEIIGLKPTTLESRMKKLDIHRPD